MFGLTITARIHPGDLSVVRSNLIKHPKISAALALVALASAVLLFLAPWEEIQQPVEKQLRFTYTLKNTASELITQADFSAMMPIEIPGVQHVTSVEATQPYTVLKNNAAQNSIKFGIQNLPPFGVKVITVTLHVTLAPTAHKESINKQHYLNAQKYIELDAASVHKIATQVKKETPLLTVKAAYEWLVNNIQDVGYLAQAKGAQFALEQRTGDCTEHMYALIALARANGIPARGVAGFMVEQSAGILNASNYHNWAEFHDGKKWILVDSQKHHFDEQYSHYIVTHFLAEESAPSTTERFLTTDNRIEVSL
jgi:transglutaminase-like putative cysteine protease